MHDVICVNLFPRKLMKFPRKEKESPVPYPLLCAYLTADFTVMVNYEKEFIHKSFNKKRQVILSHSFKRYQLWYFNFD